MSGILDLAGGVLNLDPEDLVEGGLCSTTVGEVPDVDEVILEDLIYNARHKMESFILNCTFMGIPCAKDDFIPFLTTFGLCYTFNSGFMKPVIRASGTGMRQGLTVFVDIDQDQYVASPSLDAGMRVVVLPQSEPPIPLDQGIAVPPGTNGFIGLTRRDIIDRTGRSCRLETDVSGLNYLRNYSYSVSACSLDCFLTQIARRCNCSYLPRQYPPNPGSPFAELRQCTLRDICCIQLEALSPEQCDCRSLCDDVQYNTFTSYATLPATYVIEALEELFQRSLEGVREDIVAVNVYFETPNVETITTTSAYSVVALLSDIGGQLGLFLGVSVISMMEFGMWLMDEFRDRCLCCVFTKKEKKVEVDGGAEMEVEVDGGAEMKEKSVAV